VNLNYTNTYYSLPQITADEFGLNHALSGSTWSRNICLWTYPEQPESLLVTESGGQLTLTWNESARATSYTLYAADDPQGVFSVLESGIVDATPGDGVVTWLLGAPVTQRNITGWWPVTEREPGIARCIAGCRYAGQWFILATNGSVDSFHQIMHMKKLPRNAEMDNFNRI
jgi:hypothetical protein